MVDFEPEARRSGGLERERNGAGETEEGAKSEEDELAGDWSERLRWSGGVASSAESMHIEIAFFFVEFIVLVCLCCCLCSVVVLLFFLFLLFGVVCTSISLLAGCGD